MIKRVSAAAEAAAPPAASARSPAVVMAAAVEDPRACMGTWYVQRRVPPLPLRVGRHPYALPHQVLV